MDQSTRNTLRNTVTHCRRLLEEATMQALQGRFGIFEVGRKGEVQVEDVARMTHLSEEDYACRRDLVDHLTHITSLGYKPSEALEQLIREIAFTHLNRLCAYKMMEARGLIREAVSRGLKSQGFLFYLADHPDIEKLHATGQQEAAYRHFLDWLGGTLSQEIGVLFNPNDPANRVYPPQRVLDDVLALINDESLQDIWEQDETIGWVYQYFTPKELRDKARKESQAPRNSYELAFRNQFFTPRYVVEFLTDNTLGRIWYEMTKGETSLKERCRYLVRRSNEVFLAKGEQPPVTDEPEKALSQEELLRQPVYIPFRAKKDPRELCILDPACGSGHFLLYCFDLLLLIYEEAYNDAELGAALRKDYPSLEDLRKAIPALILRHNLHGIDIDLRATQIAALALWLRCQRAYQAMNLQNGQRPPITRSNIVCAEPMPGDKDILREFTAGLQPKVLGQLVEEVFDKMKLAGEAGSLLKIEEDIKAAAVKVKNDYVRWKKQQDAAAGFLLKEYAPKTEPDLFDFADLDDEAFLERAEEEIVNALRRYAQHAGEGSAYRRRLFAEDAGRGFAFIDVCRKRYDVVLMNPPFGLTPPYLRRLLELAYTTGKNDIAAAFVLRASILCPDGLIGVLSTRLLLTLPSYQSWRSNLCAGVRTIHVLADLGYGVLDEALVEAAAYVIGLYTCEMSPCVSCLQVKDKQNALNGAISSISLGEAAPIVFLVQASAMQNMPGGVFAYMTPSLIVSRMSSWIPLSGQGVIARKGMNTSDDERFMRTCWEVSPGEIGTGRRWVHIAKGGEWNPFYDDIHLLVKWDLSGYDMVLAGGTLRNASTYFRKGLTYPERTTSSFGPRVLPEGCVFSTAGLAIHFDDTAEPLTYLGFLLSRPGQMLVEISLGTGDTSVSGTAARHYTNGMINRLPAPDLRSFPLALDIRQIAHSLVIARRSLFDDDETSRYFQIHLPTTACTLREFACHQEIERLQVLLKMLADVEELERFSVLAIRLSTEMEREFLANMTSPNVLAYSEHVSPNVIKSVRHSYCEDEFDIIQRLVTKQGSGARYITKNSQLIERKLELVSHLYEVMPSTVIKTWVSVVNEEGVSDALLVRVVVSLLSLTAGVAFGRWDIRFATGERQPPALPDPFDPLPVCPPGMLQNADGLPAVPEDVPADYPLRISWSGILVDDDSHPEDIVTRVRAAIEVIWPDRSDAIEREACEILGVRELRDYFRKPGNGGFWMDHVKRYSKSRRKAPIYWYLRSAKGNYGLWLYYHRLDKDTYFKCLVNYVEPKLRLEEDRLQALRTRKAEIGNAGREAKQIEKDIDRQEQFVIELHDFHDKLRRIADLHLIPNLNDGVILNIAPLYELVPWKEAEKTWEALQDAKYDWAHIAYQLWPDRVRELCKRDLSVAIAHGLEDICEVETPKSLRDASADDDEIEEDDQDE
jgi:hypothetical protein